MSDVDLRPLLGARVRALRAALGLTQEQLAERADMHWTFISGVERGLKDPRINTVARLAHALGVTTDQLLRRDGPAAAPARRSKRR